MISLVFCGDYAPCRRFEAVVTQKKSLIIGDAARVIKEADFSFVNLECPLTTHTVAINKSGPAHRADPKCVWGLSDFTVAGLANNHSLDFGEKGLLETIAVCNSAGIETVGAGKNLEEAQAAFISEVKGVKIALIAVAEHEFNQSEKGGAGCAPLDPIDNFQQIKKARSEADVVIVTIHGGNEYFHYPRPGLRKTCKHFIDLGVDAVICHHPHVPGAYEMYSGKPIIYSLGNFIFDRENAPDKWDSGYIAKLTFDEIGGGGLSLELIPYKQSIELGGVKLMEGEERAKELQRLEMLRSNLEGDVVWQAEWDSWVSKNSKSYLARQYFPVAFRGIGWLSKNTAFLKLFFWKKKALPKLNMLRCQSHRELLVAAVEANSPERNG